MNNQSSLNIKSGMRKNIWFYSIYYILREAHLWIYFVVWVVFLREVRGLNLFEITIIDAAFWISMVSGEIPTGVVADRMGRKLSLLIGAFLNIIGLLIFILSGRFVFLILANVILGIGFTFHSGAGDALLYESVQAAGFGKSYTTIVGRLAALGKVSTILAGLAGSAVALAGLMYPYIAGCALAVLLLIVIVFIQEPPKNDPSSAEKALSNAGDRESYRSILAGAVRVLRYPGAFSIVLFMAVAATISYLIVLLVQAYATSFGATASITAIAVVLINTGGIVGSLLAGRISTAGTGKRLIFLTPVIIAVQMFLAALGTQLHWVILTLMITSFVFSLIMPALHELLNRLTPNAMRATVLSFQSIVSTAMLTISAPAAGAVADSYGSRYGFVLIGCLAAAYSIYHLLKFRAVTAGLSERAKWDADMV